jgi:transcriptional regulator with XRE-family HTH domain
VNRHRAGVPAWAERIRSERITRRWSQAEAVRALRVHFPGDPASDASLLRDWSYWESGRVEPAEIYKPVLAETFGTVTAALFPPEPALIEPPPAGLSTLEVLARIRSPDLDGVTLEALATQVEELCTRYALVPAGELLAQTRSWRGRITDLLGHRLTLNQHRDLLRLSGWLALLSGCLEWDLGRTTRAEVSRATALALGVESGSDDVVGWACELQAWFALTQGDYRTVLVAAESGRAVAGGRGAQVQLSAQTAQAWARIGERRPAEVALDRSRRLLEALPQPDNPGNHFVVDPSRFDLWAMDCYRVLGEDRLAAGYAREVLRGGVRPDGRQRSPMRATAARLTLAVAAARGGDLETAVHHGGLALSGTRVSLPSLVITSRELARIIDRDFAGAAVAGAFLDEQRALERKVLSGPR